MVADPGRHLLGRRERDRVGTDFGNDLLRRIDAEAGDGRQSLHRILMAP